MKSPVPPAHSHPAMAGPAHDEQDDHSRDNHGRRHDGIGDHIISHRRFSVGTALAKSRCDYFNRQKETRRAPSSSLSDADSINVSRLQFWVLNLVSVVLAALIGFEMYSSIKLDEARDQLREAEAPALAFEAVQPLARNMVEETARGAAHDPELRRVLAKYGFQVDAPVTAESLHASTQPPSSP